MRKVKTLIGGGIAFQREVVVLEDGFGFGLLLYEGQFGELPLQYRLDRGKVTERKFQYGAVAICQPYGEVNEFFFCFITFVFLFFFLLFGNLLSFE